MYVATILVSRGNRPKGQSMRKFLVLLAAMVIPLSIAGYAIADRGRSEAAKAQSATARYHDLQDALDDGYSILPATTTTPTVVARNGCAASALGLGGMGVHYLKAGQPDGSLDAQSPEVLVYEPQANGRSKLVALEYVVAAPGPPSPAPTLFGQEFAWTNLAPYGLPAVNVWTLHAWIWAPNPSGLLFAWNPRVTCGNA
jgi:hypothetical protein